MGKFHKVIFGVIFIMGFKLKHNPHPFLRCFSSSVYERLQLCLSSTLHMNEPISKSSRNSTLGRGISLYFLSGMNYFQNVSFSSIITFFYWMWKFIWKIPILTAAASSSPCNHLPLLKCILLPTSFVISATSEGMGTQSPSFWVLAIL